MPLDITERYDASFKGVPFLELYSNGFAPEPGAEGKDAILEVPGANDPIHQDFGRAARTFDVAAALARSDFEAMLLKRGQSGSLVYHAGTVTARLRGVKSPLSAGSGLDVLNVTLSFIL